jgi:hypothetical protein
LKEQAGGPIGNPKEMASNHDLAVKDTLVITVMKHVMDVYLNYVTVLMEFVILKTYAKQDGTDLSVHRSE